MNLHILNVFISTNNHIKKYKIMDSIFNYVSGFVKGMTSFLMGLIPLTILWDVLTGGAIFNINVIDNLTNLINTLGNGGFVGLVVLVLLTSFFVKK